MLTNSEIGEQFGLTYSSITRRVALLKKRLEGEEEIRNRYKNVKSQVKVCPVPVKKAFSGGNELMSYHLVLGRRSYQRRKESLFL